MHYRILSALGEGGMGAVFRAEDTRLGRQVALKVLRPDLVVSPERLQRFEREARAASVISHPGVATLYDIHHDGETVFLAMEFVEGKNLRQLLEEGRLPLSRLLDCLLQVSEALGAAHQKGIVHRDLKPENIMAADSGFYKILDFGLARIALREDSGQGPLSELTQMLTLSRNLTTEGHISGTLAYMSPEQIQGEAVDARSDIFSFGVLAYELATGASPFKGRNLLATFHAIVHEEPPLLSSLRPEAPPELDRIVAKCLAKDPGGRYATTGELAAELRALKRRSDSGNLPLPAGTNASKESATPGAAAGRTGIRRWAVAGWIAAAGFVLTGIAVAVLVLTGKLPQGSGEGSSPSHPPGAAGPADVASPRPPMHPPAGPSDAVFGAAADRSRIAITPFVNRSGDPGADWLSQGLPEMLTTDLARVPGLQLISSQRLQDFLSAAGKGEMKDLDRGATAQLGRYAGAGVVVNGSIFKSGGSYRVDVQASDTATGEVLAAHRAEGSDIFKIADELGLGLKKGLRMGTAGEQGPRIAATSSPDAYRAYTEGEKLYQSVRFPEAAKAFRHSLQIDPEFASAQLRLGMSLFLSGKTEEGMTWIRRASQHPDSLPERERLLAAAIEASAAPGEAGKGADSFKELSERYPRDPESLFWRAEAQSGRPGGRFEAIRILHDAVDVDPNDALSVSALVRHLDEMGMNRDAAAILEDFKKRTSAPMEHGAPPPATPPPPPAKP